MAPFTLHRGRVAPLDRANVDTDAILPKQFMKSTARTGYGSYLFDAERYLDEGHWGMDCRTRPLNPDFVLNQARYAGATVLLARRNFGCGSSREHAPWALAEFGFRALIAPSFADIFQDNCIKNGVLPISLPEAQVDDLFRFEHHTPAFELTIDLPRQLLLTPVGEFPFAIRPYDKTLLLTGDDEIAFTLSHGEALDSFERKHWAAHPWLVG